MQTKNLLFLLTAFTIVSLSVWAEPGLKKSVEGEKTEVYYFHNTRRCPTCMAIEKETKKVLKEQPFADAEENEKLASQLGAARQYLEIADLLGYGHPTDYDSLYEQLDAIEEKTYDGKSGRGFFDNITEKVRSLLSAKTS